jgi:outer membrane lipoprotein-sorting protein
MKFLRTTSTSRLLAVIAGLLVAIAAGTAIAVAGTSGGPVPPHSQLAQAIHRALDAKAVNGISARITFTNHLIDASSLQGSDPLLQGASGRLWVSTAHGLRIELQSDNGDGQVVVQNGAFWVYDPSSNTVYQGKLPAGVHQPGGAEKGKHGALPSIAQIQTDLNRLAQHVALSGAIPSDVAGQPTYTVRVSPKHDGGMLGKAELAWDAARGIPLRVAVYARNDSSPVLELKVTNISYGRIPASDLAISPPRGAKVVRISNPASDKAGAADKVGASDKAAGASKRRSEARSHQTKVAGVAAVARRLSFRLRAPQRLVGLPRQSVSLLDWGGKPAALLTFGQNLGGIAVIEQTADHAASASSSSTTGERRGLSLPTVSIGGATGQELDTALGTMIRFTRAGVMYTVVGSVPPTAAEAAARAL